MSKPSSNSHVKPEEPRDLVIMGAGGFAREVAWLVADINRAHPGTWNLIGFCEHGTERIGQLINGVPVIGMDEIQLHLPGLYAVAAIGDPRPKARAVNEAEDIGCRFATLIHPNVEYDRSSVEVGEGSIVCAGNILTVNITIAKHVILNIDCTVGHDSIVEDYATISPGCHLSGHTTVRRSAFLGTGVVTIEHCEIGEGSIVGAGGVVVRSIPPGVTAIGAPARAKDG